jgi:hypothetical protein
MLLLVLFPLIIFYSGCPTPTDMQTLGPSIVGAWEAAAFSPDGIGLTDVTMNINADASFVLTYDGGGGSNLQTGTLSPATLPAGTTLTVTVAYADGPQVPPSVPATWTIRYSNLKAATVDLEGDPNSDGWEAFTFNKQTSSIVGTWSCASAGPFTALVITINADCSFSLSYQYLGSNTQTGTFHPYTMNADTDLTATVATSSGPQVPKPPSTVTITIASPAIITWTAHGIAANTPVVFTTTGDLPTGLLPGTKYYVVGSSITADTFQVSSTPGGAAVDTSGTQSGTHTGWSAWLLKYTNLTATSVDASIDTTGTGSAYMGPFTFSK